MLVEQPSNHDESLYQERLPMNSARTTISHIILLSSMVAGLTHARVALAGGDAAKPAGTPQAAADNSNAQPGATVQPPAKDPKAAASNAVDDSEKFGPRITQRITKINKLRQMMEEKVELTSEQKKKIGRLFDDFIEDTKNSSPKRAKDPNTPSNKIFPPTMRDLEKQLQKAQEAGDEAAVEKIRQEIKILKKEPATPADDHSPILIEKITAELKPEQVAAFENVVERWKAVSPRGPRTGPFQQLRRALQDPEVGLSEAEKTTVEKILTDTLQSVREGGERNPEKMAQAVEKARVVIYEKLTPQQRSKVEANLKAFKAEEKGLDDSKYRGPHKVDKPKKDTKAGPKKESTDKGTPDEEKEADEDDE